MKSEREGPQEGEEGALSLARVAVVIPAFNEERALPLVLRDLPLARLLRVIVVDNASTDRTAEVAREGGAVVVREERPGYGAACLRGIAALPGETEIVVFVDGDHSDHLEELPRLVEPIARGESDLVIGSRMLGRRERGALLPQAYLGNKLAVFLIRALWGVRYTDLGPFRAIGREALDRLGMSDTTFGWTVEMQVRAIQEGLRVREVPVSYRRRVGKSKITGTVSGTVRAGMKIIGTILALKRRERRLGTLKA